MWLMYIEKDMIIAHAMTICNEKHDHLSILSSESNYVK